MYLGAVLSDQVEKAPTVQKTAVIPLEAGSQPTQGAGGFFTNFVPNVLGTITSIFKSSTPMAPVAGSSINPTYQTPPPGFINLETAAVKIQPQIPGWVVPVILGAGVLLVGGKFLKPRRSSVARRYRSLPPRSYMRKAR